MVHLIIRQTAPGQHWIKVKFRKALQHCCYFGLGIGQQGFSRRLACLNLQQVCNGMHLLGDVPPNAVSPW